MPVMTPQPAQKRDSLGQALSVGGAIAGTLIGSPGGPGAAVQGGLTGHAVGQAAGGMLASGKPRQAVGTVDSGPRGALQRRAAALQPIQPENYGLELAKAETAAQTLPPALRDQYLPTIQAARARSGGQGVV